MQIHQDFSHLEQNASKSDHLRVTNTTDYCAGSISSEKPTQTKIHKHVIWLHSLLWIVQPPHWKPSKLGLKGGRRTRREMSCGSVKRNYKRMCCSSKGFQIVQWSRNPWDERKRGWGDVHIVWTYINWVGVKLAPFHSLKEPLSPVPSGK